MLRNALIGSLLLAFATSTLACANPTDATSPETTSKVSSALATNPVLNMAASLAGEVGGRQLGEALFPADPIDYERLNRDFATAIKQANVNQTVTEQSGRLYGVLGTIQDAELRLSAGGDIDTGYADMDASLSDVNDILSKLSTDDTKTTGLSAYVAAAQMKISILGRLAQLKPATAPAKQAVLVANTQRFFDEVAQVKQGLERAALTARQSQIGLCTRTIHALNMTIELQDGSNVQSFDGSSYDDMTNACEAFRADLVNRVGGSALSQVQKDLGWIDGVLASWTQIIGANAIVIESATFGANVGAAAGNATPFVAMDCENKSTCDYAIKASVIGDTKHTQSKDFSVAYTCAAGGVEVAKTASLPANADNQTLTLSCP